MTGAEGARALWGSEAGAAMVEAVVLLPFFVLLMGGVYSLHDQASSRAHAKQLSRACAWALALDGCREPVPEICGEEKPDLQAGTEELSGGEISQEEVGKLDGVMDVPGLGALLRTLLGKPVQVERRVPLARDGALVASGVSGLLCNTKPGGWPSLGSKLFNRVEESEP
jgi:hypothetical protein